MKHVFTLTALAAMAVAPSVVAQSWEVGGGAGGGFYTSQDVTGPSGSASAKVQTGVAGAAWLDNNGSGKWGGELRYDYQMGALELNSDPRRRPLPRIRRPRSTTFCIISLHAAQRSGRSFRPAPVSRFIRARERRWFISR